MEAEEEETINVKNEQASSGEDPAELPGSKASSKRTILEEKENKPRKKLKLASVNAKLKRELGEDAGDLSESDSEEESEEDVVDENNKDVPQSLVPKKTEDTSNGVFHRRLTTGADKQVHSKVSEALEKITKKEEAEKEDLDSDEADIEDDEEEEDSDEESDEESDDSDDDKESVKDQEIGSDAEEG